MCRDAWPTGTKRLWTPPLQTTPDLGIAALTRLLYQKHSDELYSYDLDEFFLNKK
jgi:hypothetical protein